jgi:glutathione S-transferase
MTCVEKGIPYELVPIDRGSDAHGALHPFRRMPILEIDGTIIVESLAITCHLDEAFAGPILQPEDHAGRAQMRTWMSVCADYLFRDVVRTVPRGRRISAEERTTARTTLERAEQSIEANPFLVGDTLTLADLYLAPQIANCLEKAPDLLEGLDGLTSWSRFISARDSFRLTAYENKDFRLAHR